MAKSAPLIGYNTNIDYRGQTYHVQTEDSGRDYAHVTTHLFANGGRIVASRKTEYDGKAPSEERHPEVKRIMASQHRAVCAALEAGEYDGVLQVNPQTAPSARAATHNTAATEVPVSSPSLARIAIGLAEQDFAKRSSG